MATSVEAEEEMRVEPRLISFVQQMAHRSLERIRMGEQPLVAQRQRPASEKGLFVVMHEILHWPLGVNPINQGALPVAIRRAARHYSYFLITSTPIYQPKMPYKLTRSRKGTAFEIPAQSN